MASTYVLLFAFVYILFFYGYRYIHTFTVCSTNVCMVIHVAQGMDQPGEVANPPRGQLNREN